MRPRHRRRFRRRRRARVASGVETLIPETGQESLTWIADLQDAGGLFFLGAWLDVFAGLFGLVALVGFYDALREAGTVMIVAPIAGVVGLTLVTISHVIPVAMAYELAPGYSEASASAQGFPRRDPRHHGLAEPADELRRHALGWRVAVPLYTVAILKTSALPNWIGWLGLVVAVFAGWLGLLAPASDLVEGR